MPNDIISLRYPGTCSKCNAALPAKTKAHWDGSSKTIICLECGGHTTQENIEYTRRENVDQGSPPTPSAPLSGRAGASAAFEYQRRHDKREAMIDQRFGRFSKVVKFLVDDPQSTRAWAKGSAGERELADALTRRIGDRAVLLHDRRIPKSRANIDHIAVAASGVWVIDAKTYSGKVERRDKGGWFKLDYHLYVAGRDRTRLAAGLVPQVAAVRRVLEAVGTTVDVHAALCFIDAEWGLFAKPFQMDGVWVTWGRALSEMIAGAGPLSKLEVIDVANALAAGLPPAMREP
jgi:hypothetical protein